MGEVKKGEENSKELKVVKRILFFSWATLETVGPNRVAEETE